VSKEACIALVWVLGACVLAAAGLVDEPGAAKPRPPERAVFAGGPATLDAPSELHARERATQPERTHAAGGSVVRVRRGRSVLLHPRPGGRARFVLGHRTPFGSETVLPVVRRRAGWLGVLSSALPSGELGWIRDDARALTASRNRLRVVVERSEQRLTVVRRGRAIATVAVGGGRPGSETPIGRFAVTDKLPGTRFTRSYGCCILALTGRQSSLPAGWRGGNRLAIHGTDGRSASRTRSAGCVTIDARPLRWLMSVVPLGTVVTVRD
jgi:hypothetical protein